MLKGVKKFIEELCEKLYVEQNRKQTRIIPVYDTEFNVIGYLPQFRVGWEYFDVRIYVPNNWTCGIPATLEECKNFIDQFHLQDSETLLKKYRSNDNVIHYP